MVPTILSAETGDDAAHVGKFPGARGGIRRDPPRGPSDIPVMAQPTVGTDALAAEIERIWARAPAPFDDDDRRAIAQAVALVDRGEARVAERSDGAWTVNLWVKKALDLYYRTSEPTLEHEVGPLRFRDRFPSKHGLEDAAIRLVPPGAARYGSFAGPGATLSSCFLHLGVWVGADSLIDTWVALGTCAQIGARVKILPCTSVVGSLYPLDARPTIVEDDCHIGSGCVIGPGTLVRRGAILAPGVTISAATRVADLRDGSARPLRDEVPENAIVVPGSIPVPWSGTLAHVSAALVIGRRDPDMTPKQNLAVATRRLGLGPVSA